MLPQFSPAVLDTTTGSSFALGVEAKPSSAPRTAHVLHLINGEHYAGAERVQDLLSARLEEFGFRVSLACAKPGQFAERRQHHDAPLHTVRMRHKLDLATARELARLVEREKVDLLHAHTPRTAWLARLAAPWLRVPLVYHVHSPTSRDTTHGLRNVINSWSERLSLTRAVRLICVSHSLAAHMEGCGYSRDILRVVHNGVPGNGHLPARERPTDRWTLGAMALFRPRKGMEVLLEALARLSANSGLPPVHLRAVGGFESPAYEQELRRRAEQLGIARLVTWTGFTHNIQAELAQMDLFALPSLFGEGLPMVVLEAMAAGVPVVATGVEGVTEAVRDGIDGVIAQPNDADSLVAALARVLRGEVDWLALRTSAFARHAAQFSDRTMAAGVAAVYREVLADAEVRMPKAK